MLNYIITPIKLLRKLIVRINQKTELIILIEESKKKKDNNLNPAQP